MSLSVDRGYLNLVSHLNRHSTSLPLSTVLSSVAHYLARVQPSATPLAAIVISSPLFRPHAYADLDGLVTAFRHAVHLKIKVVADEPAGLFSRGLSARVAEWAVEVLKGLQGGHSVLRLACCAGLVQGMVDREGDLKLKESSARRKVEEELIVALAEVVEYASSSPDPWEAEFRSRAQQEEDVVPATLVIASRSLPLVAPHRLRALPLLNLCRILQSALTTAFRNGSFLQALQASITTAEGGRLSIATDSQFARDVKQVSANLLFTHMATLSGMYAQIMSVLADSRPLDAWLTISGVIHSLDQLATAVENDWSGSPLSGVDDEERLAPQTKDVALQVWTVLKTLLFTNVRLLQQVLNVVLFVSPPLPSAASSSTHDTSTMRLLQPFEIAHMSLQTLSHLSFVLPRFGGVSSTASSALPELLKAFYTALDVLSTSPDQSRLLIRTLQTELHSARQKALPSHFVKAKEAYMLSCVEQLVSVLDDKTIREDVWPMCEPHLNDPSHRETYESAHSVMLAMFSAHAKRRRAGDASIAVSSLSSLAVSGLVVETEVLEHEDNFRLPFAEQVVPAYARCLIDNSYPDKLNTTQLRLAYAALVGCAAVFGSSQCKNEAEAARTPEGDAYAWFCITLILDAVKAYDAKHLTEREHEHRQKLLLALVSIVPSVSLRLLPRLLTAVLELLEGSLPSAEDSGDEEASSDRRDDGEELTKALFEELLNVGDEEKEYAIWWWGEHKSRFAHVIEGRHKEGASGDTDILPHAREKGKAPVTAARL